MAAFFDSAGDRVSVTQGSACFSLPIHYYRDDAFSLFFSADLEAVRACLPTDKLHPVQAGRGRAVVAVAAFNYINTSIGPYGEVAIGVPVVHGRRPLPLLPALLESHYPGFGVLVLHLPVTHQVARDAGRGQWGYTKFVADMRFDISPEQLSCRLSEAGEHILTLRVAREGWFGRDRKPLTTFSVRKGELLRTTIPQQGSYRWRSRCKKSSMETGAHSVGQFLQRLDLSAEPLLKRYYVERCAILPAGQAVETGVRALDGYRGVDGDAEHSVYYGDEAAS